MSFFRDYLRIDIEVEFCLFNRMEPAQYSDKLSNDYQSEVAVCLISENDANNLSVKTRDTVKTVSQFGTVNLNIIVSNNTRDGLALIPIGIWGRGYSRLFRM